MKNFSLIVFLGIFIAGCQQAPVTSTNPSPSPTAIVVEAPLLGSVPAPSTPPKVEDRKVEIKVEKQNTVKDAIVSYTAYNAKAKIGNGEIKDPNNTTTLTIPNAVKDEDFTLSLTFNTKGNSKIFHGIYFDKNVKVITISIEKKDDVYIATYKIDGKSNKTVLEI